MPPSRFKRGNRWGVFPGFSAGWRLSEEAFIKNLNLFSNLKLRASWGQLGNQTIEGYWPYLTVISQNYDLSYNYGGSLAPGAAVTALVDWWMRILLGKLPLPWILAWIWAS